MTWNVYLSGEIHSDWRQQIIDGASQLELPVEFTSAVTDHDASDAAGDMLGPEVSGYWRDHKSSKVNAIFAAKPCSKNAISRWCVSVISTSNGTRRLTPVTVPRSASPTSPCTPTTSYTH